MSLDALRDFRAKVNATPALQEAMRPFLSPNTVTEEVARMGKENGFDFTWEEVAELYESEMKRPNRELSDYELELVAGGTGAPTGPTSFTAQEVK
jgi:predicted ribosomally synthesized peptide with nif11-like leader